MLVECKNLKIKKLYMEGNAALQDKFLSYIYLGKN